jgi:hypothetical protein
MNLYITPPEQINVELTAIDAFLNITCSEQIEEVVARGNDIAVYIARSGKLLADAKHHLNRCMQADVWDALRRAGKQAGASNTAVNAIIASLCRDERYLVDWAERTNRTATHQLEWCRTLISKAKAEMAIAPPMYNK